MKALILAAGFGVRLREVIHGRPKHLAPINGKPFLRHLINLLKKRQVEEVIIAVGYLSRYIVDEFSNSKTDIKIKFSEDNRPLGTAGSLKNSEKHFKADFLIINGDTYLDIDYSKLFKAHQSSKALLTLVGTTKSKKGSLIESKKNLVTSFASTSKSKSESTSYHHAGIYVASLEIFNYIHKHLKYSIEKDLIPKLLSKNKTINLYPIHKSFIDIDDSDSYQKAQETLK